VISDKLFRELQSMKESILAKKSMAFAVRIVRLCQHLTLEKKERILTKQLLRSGTAIGALVCEAKHAESAADFAHKLAIAQKENNETLYWLELLKETNYLTQSEYDSVNNDALELIRIIAASIKTVKARQANKNI